MSINFELLKKAAYEDRLAHFLIFHGSGEEERHRAVLELALMLNCRENDKPCGQCTACKKVQSGNHPDVHIVRPQKTSVGIEQIISLQGKVYRKIYEGRYRICLIEEADKLTLPAANALLRIAEEPPENTVIVLSCGNAEGIIDTLQSRGQAVYFPPPDEELWGDGKDIFQISGGDPDLARRIEEYGIEKVKGWIARYVEAIESGDFLKTFELFPLEREECLIILQGLAVTIKDMVVEGRLSPHYLKEIRNTSDLIRRQVNHRLALEVLALKHIKLGGTKIG